MNKLKDMTRAEIEKLSMQKNEKGNATVDALAAQEYLRNEDNYWHNVGGRKEMDYIPYGDNATND